MKDFLLLMLFVLIGVLSTLFVMMNEKMTRVSISTLCTNIIILPLIVFTADKLVFIFLSR